MNNKFDKTKVKELTNKDYKIENDTVTIKKNKQKGLVVFYYHWCGYCNIIAPDLIKLANKKDISVYAIHGENPKNKKVFEKLEIQGVPHIRLVKSNGVISDVFQGNRTTEDFYKFIKTQRGGYSTCGGKNKLKKTKGYKKQKGGVKLDDLPKDLENIVLSYKKDMDKNATEISVKIKMEGYKDINIVVDKKTKVYDVKSIISKKRKLNSPDIHVFFKGKKLVPRYSLDDYSVKDDSILKLEYNGPKPKKSSKKSPRK